MNFLKALLSWKLWLSIILGGLVLFALWHFTFKWMNGFTNHGVEVSVPDISEMTIQQAIKTLDDLDLDYSVDSVKFTEKSKPFAVLDFFPTAGSKVKPGRRVFIKSNPSTWQPVELPDLVDKSKRLGYTQLIMKGFMVGDTTYIQDPAKDAILKVMYAGKEVKAGTMLPRGAKIDLILGRGFRLDMPVPDVTGLNVDQAKAIIESKFFALGQVYYFGGDRDTLSTKVFYQDPPGAEMYDEGLPISLYLSSMPASSLRKQIDSLDLLFRRKLDEKDSIFFESIKNSEELNLRDLPEDVRNQVKYDQAVNEDMRPEEKPTNNQAPKIDTTGIVIE